MNAKNGMCPIPSLGLSVLLVMMLMLAPGAQPFSHATLSQIEVTQTRLADGRELLLGGRSSSGNPNPARLRDPDTGSLQSLPERVLAWRSGHTVTLLPDGRVLIVGGRGTNGEPLANAELWDTVSQVARSLPLPDHLENHSAQLNSNGEVLLWTHDAGGGIRSWRFDVSSTAFISQTDGVPPQDAPAIDLGVSSPLEGAQDVSPDTRISLVFSRPIAATNLSDASVLLNGPSGTVSTRRVVTESGRLLFLMPEHPLDAGATYTVNLHDLRDIAGQSFTHVGPTFSIRALPADTPAAVPDGSRLPATSQSVSVTRNDARDRKSDAPWLPTRNPDGSLDWETGYPPAPAASLPALQAAPGVTALAGQVLRLNGEPLAGVKVEIGSVETYTNKTGRFLLAGIPDGHQELEVEGMSANTKHATYGCYEIGVDIRAGETSVLPYTIWMPVLDTANAVKIPSPTTREVVVTSPNLLGLELRIPPSTVILDEYEKPVTEITLTPVPLDRPPYPMPKGVSFPMYFTVQPGGAYVYQMARDESGGWAYVKKQGIRVLYPNVHHDQPGTQVDYWHYDAEDLGWYVYGSGRVGEDGNQVVPDMGVAIYELAGASYYYPDTPPPPGPPPGGGGGGGGGGGPGGGCPGCCPGGAGGGDECADTGKDGDPVDLATGLFVHEATDLVIPDIIPITIRRSYRAGDSGFYPRDFGVGMSHLYEMRLWNMGGYYQSAELVLPDSGRVPFTRISPGTSISDAVFEHVGTPTRFYKSRITRNGSGWDLTLKDGTVYVFGGDVNNAALLGGIRDRIGNTLHIDRDASGKITRITTPNGRWVSITYTLFTSSGKTHNLVKVINDRTGRQVVYDYDGAGNLIMVTDPLGQQTNYSYSSQQMTSVTDHLARVTLTNVYDNNGRIGKQTLADGGIYLFNYTTDSNGIITQTEVTDPRGNKRRMTFDSAGYPLSDVRALGTADQQTWSYVRRSDNLLQEVTDPLGYKTAYNSYDDFGNVLSLTKAVGTPQQATWGYTYEPLYQQVKTVTDPLGHMTTRDYYPNGDLQKITDATGRSVNFTYQTDGRIASVTDGAGNATSFTYDGADLVSLTDPNGNTSTFYSDVLGRLTHLRNGANELSRIEYDLLDRATRLTNPLGHNVTLDYDPNGNLESLTAPAGGVTGVGLTAWAYDPSNRLSTRTDPLGRQDRYTLYDPRGNLLEAFDRKNQKRSYTYDALDRLTQVTYADGSTTAYAYDPLGRLLTVTDSLAGDISRSYDPLGRLTEESSPEGTVSYGYDLAGRRTSLSVNGASPVTYGYDDADRLTGITEGALQVSLSYDTAGRRETVSYPNGIQATYTYDAAANVKTIVYRNGAVTVGDIRYDYDAANRRIRVGGSLMQTPLPPTLGSASYDAANQLLSFDGVTHSLDANGNVTSDGASSYVWNARDQLTGLQGAVSASFGYDGLGRRRWSSTPGLGVRGFLHDGQNVVKEQTLSGAVSLLNGLGLDERYTRSLNGVTRSFMTDALGSTVAIGSPTGTLGKTHAYEPFGATVTTTGSGANAYHYTGRENDNTGLYYYRARYYHPRWGRFISSDPIGEAGGLNVYAYVGNSPGNWVDPLGLAKVCRRALEGLPGKAGPLSHSQILFDDGSDIGFFDDDKIRPDKGHKRSEYKCDSPHYPDKEVKDAVDGVKKTWDPNWNLVTNNCHDFADEVIDRVIPSVTGRHAP